MRARLSANAQASIVGRLASSTIWRPPAPVLMAVNGGESACFAGSNRCLARSGPSAERAPSIRRCRSPERVVDVMRGIGHDARRSGAG